MHTLLLSIMLWLAASEPQQDSIKTAFLDEVSIVSTLKESGTLRQQPISASHISSQQLMAKGATGMKGIETMAPNLFMPDYGSKQTSAIYMRGIGSRIGTPAVGMYVDNVPYYEKSAFDFSFYDVESIDVLRGPQSTLYGRNAMSGLIRIRTKNPFDHTGTDVRLDFATKENRGHASVTHYHHISDKFAFSAGGFYDATNGFFKNDMSGKKVDAAEAAGGRMRAVLKANNRLTLDMNLSYEYTDEGAYPYFYTGSTVDKEDYEGFLGKISANLDGRYRRGLLNASINTEYKTDGLTLNSVTALQNINDRMFMDQDFLNADIYSLEQKQKINTLSEEILLKNNGRKIWNWLTGLNVFYQWQNIKAPVTFRKDGVAWLNNIINTNANRFMPPVEAGPMTMSFVFADNINGDVLPFDDDFDTPTMGAALFHQSTFNDLLGIEGLKATVGMRLDYEKMKMDCTAWYDMKHTYSLNGHLSGMMGGKPMDRDIAMVPEQTFDCNGTMHSNISNDYLELLPKASLMYDISCGNVYATISRGYRSGGYNPQNISELLRTMMQTDMMRDVRDVTVPVLEAQPMVPAETKDTVKGILNRMATATEPDVEGTCSYKPEYAWNYEVGTHLSFIEHKLTVDATAFMSNVEDLQLSVMSATGLGRTIKNAGSSRSLGIELAMNLRPIDNLSIMANYGYTHATFREYSIFDSNNKEVDCHGNHVPYVPSHTVNADIAYTLPINGNMLKTLTIGMDYSGAGKIFWDEQNSYSQSFYNMLGARLQLTMKHINLTLWGRNLTNTKYNTFWFETMNRGFEQHGKPIQMGASVALHL